MPNKEMGIYLYTEQRRRRSRLPRVERLLVCPFPLSLSTSFFTSPHRPQRRRRLRPRRPRRLQRVQKALTPIPPPAISILLPLFCLHRRLEWTSIIIISSTRTSRSTSTCSMTRVLHKHNTVFIILKKLPILPMLFLSPTRWLITKSCRPRLRLVG